MKILDMRWKDGVRAEERKNLVLFSALFQLLFFSLLWEQIWCLSDAAVHRFLNFPVWNWFFISITAALESFMRAVLLARQWAAVMVLELFYRGTAGVSSWAVTVGVEGVKPTYSLNTFMPFHWGSCLFTVVKEANLFSCLAYLCFSFTVKFFFFYFAILLIFLSLNSLCVILYFILQVAFCLFRPAQQYSSAFHDCPHVRISFCYSIFFICDQKSRGLLF